MFSDRNPSGPVQEDPTTLGKGTLWKGDINAGTEGLRIEGTLEGTITSEGRVTIAPAGLVKGTIRARHLIVTGKAVGQFRIAECLEIHGTGWVEGEMELGSLVVDEGSTLQGTCTRLGARQALLPGSAASPEPRKPPAAPARPVPPATGSTVRPLTVILGLVAAVALLVAYRNSRQAPVAEAPVAAPAPVELPPPPAPAPRVAPARERRPVAPRPVPAPVPEEKPAAPAP